MIESDPLSKLIGAICGAALGPGGWEEMLEAISRATSASIGGLIIGGTGGVPDIAVTTGADPVALTSYEHHYRKIDPVIPHVFGKRQGRVVTQGMVIERSKMVRTEFYNDWLRPQDVDDCLATKVTDTGKPGILAFAVPARRGSFDANAVRLVELLV